MYITSICYLGAKSLSHVLSCIERCKEKLLAVGQESTEARRQIVRSVMSYWADQPGVGANVVDKLLNYSVLTPASVIEWALVEAGPESLSLNHVWEMVSTTVNKVNNRVRQIVAARPVPAAIPGLETVAMVEGDADGDGNMLGEGGKAAYEAALEAYETTLESARIEQKQIAELLLGALARIARGEGQGPGEEEWALNMEVDVVGEYRVWMRWWGGQWLTAFARRYRAEGVVSEEEVKALGFCI